MRAKEFINEEVNPDIYHPEFKHEVEMHGYRYTAESKRHPTYGIIFYIKVFDGDETVAQTWYTIDDDSLVAGTTVVKPEYRGQNIATNMYAYAKMLGNDITPSSNQLDAGQAMWKAWNQSGQSKHILPKGYKDPNDYDDFLDYEEIYEDTAPEILYHVTPTRNVKSILAKGLVPSIGARSSQIETESNLFFFPSREAAEDAVMNWLGDELPEDEPLALLAVNSNGLEGKFTPGAEYEFTVSSPVPPQNIKVVTTNL